MSILAILLFVLSETLAMAWVLSANSISASASLGIIVFAEWIWEVLSLSGMAHRISIIEPRVRAMNVMLIYAGCWIVQIGGAFIFYAVMKVHALPKAFELVAAHVMISTVFYLVRIAAQGLFIKSDVSTVAGHPWWEAGASCAGISPTCGLLAILICKALGLFGLSSHRRQHEREDSNPMRQFWRLRALPGASLV